MHIGSREISSELPPYIVAEIGGNHNGKLENAIALIDAAMKSQADAVKLQCFQADTITLNCNKADFILKDGPWKGRRLYDLYKATETPREWFGDLFFHARDIGIDIFASVFSPQDVDFLEQFSPPCYKIASFEITDVGLIKYAASTRKPLIISTGMASAEEIGIAAATCHPASHIFLKCVSGYPAPIEEACLGDLTGWGISDHSLGWDVPIVATALGAQIIEKHLCLDSIETEDSDFSVNPRMFKEMVMRVRNIWKAMQPSERKSEESSRQARRSLYVIKDMKTGERF